MASNYLGLPTRHTVTKEGRSLSPSAPSDSPAEDRAMQRLESSRQGNIRYGTRNYSSTNPYHNFYRGIQNQYRTIRALGRSYPRNGSR